VTQQPPSAWKPQQTRFDVPFVPGPAVPPAYPGPGNVSHAARRPLGPGQKAAIYISGGAVALILLLCGGLTALGALAGGPKQANSGSAEPVAAKTSQASNAPSIAASAPATNAGNQSPTVEKRRVTETQEIPFETRTVNDPNLAQGTQRVRVKGVVGLKTLTYEVTLTNGVQTDKTLIAETITKPPVTQVVAIGTKQPTKPRCDPNYSGACVPIASDVDRAGGSGDGPAYVQGPVYVIGRDIYGLDRDGDGVGCE